MKRVTVRALGQHQFHIGMTLLTGGLWLPVLVLAYAKGKQIWVPKSQL
jgi:hypothetical protein